MSKTISILTTGTRGDTQPYIALGLALQKRGHRVRLAAFENYGEWVKGFGLEFYPIKGDVSQVMASGDVQHAMNADNPLKVALSFNKLKALVPDLSEDFFNACTGADAIVYHPGAAIGYFAAQHFGIPSVMATPFPMTPTREYPSLIFYDSPRLGGISNRLSHKMFQQVMWMASSNNVKKFWIRKFGRVPANFGCPFDRQTTHRLPTVISCSKYVFPTPRDWPAHVYNTGYWFLDEEPDWKPPEDLLAFLCGGPPPVYVGFGSTGDTRLAAETTTLVIDALKKAGKRGVLATGWGGMANTDLSLQDIFLLKSAPHSWLFPQMAAVVHHGGAGTTAAGFRAGVPSIIIPASNDTFAWGRRVQELGVGRTIPRKKLTTQNLADAIEAAGTPEIQRAARELGDKIKSETGAENAARIISDCLEDGNR